MNKKKLLLISDSYNVFTGFRNQMYQISNYLHSTNKYEIAYLGWFHEPANNIIPPFTYYTTLKGHDQRCCNRGMCVMKHEPDKMPVYFREEGGFLIEMNPGQPCLGGNIADHDKYAYQSLHGILLDWKPDIVFSLGDCWMTYHVNLMSTRKCFKYISYIPVDGTPMPYNTPMGGQNINWVKTLAHSDTPVAFCDFGRDAMLATARKYGEDVTKTIIIPHGCDLETYKPLNNKNELKKKLFGLEPNVFVCGFFSRNQPRKALHKLMEAVKLGKEKKYWNKTNFRIMFFCPVNDVGWHIPGLLKWHGLEDMTILNEQLGIGKGPKDDVVNEYYNACDMATLPTRGEGWGLCQHIDTIIHTKNFSSRLSDIKIGQEVLTMNGKYNKILDKTSRIVDRYYVVKPAYTLPTKVTEEHPYYISKTGTTKDLKWINVKNISLGDWIAYTKPKYDNVLPDYINIADYIKSDINFENDYIFKKMGFSPTSKLSYSKICIKYNTTKKIVEKAISYIRNNGVYDNHKENKHIYIIKSKKVLDLVSKLNSDPDFKLPEQVKILNKIKVDNDFLEFCGWYLAEGSNEDGVRIELSLHREEEPVAIKFGEWFKTNFKCEYVIDYDGPNKCRLRISSALVAEFCGNLLGIYCNNKTIPWILENGGNKLGPLFKGLFRGDGHFRQVDNHISLHTTSISLAAKTRDILAANNILVSFDENAKRDGQNFVSYTNVLPVSFINRFLKLINEPEWTIKIINKDLYREFDDCFLLRINSILLINETIPVMDICVDNTHSFISNGVLVHNTVSEAMAAGTPMLVSSYSAQHDWSKHGTARIKVAALDAEPLTNIDRAVVDVEDYCEKIKAFFDNITIDEYIAKFGPILDYSDERKLEYEKSN